jgi:hypothetical protein
MKASWRCLHKKVQMAIWVFTKLQVSLYQMLQERYWHFQSLFFSMSPFKVVYMEPKVAKAMHVKLYFTAY